MAPVAAVKDLVTIAEQSAGLPMKADEAGMFERLLRDPDITPDRLERFMALWERTEAKKAEAVFNAAMSSAQKAMRPVAADAYNPQTRSRYASYEALDVALRPIYTEHGFGLSFDTGDATQPDQVRMLCYVTHNGGHARTYKLDMPADGKGAKGGDVMTKTHATGAGISYGQRYLLKMIFNVAVGEEDNDGNAPTDKAETKDPDGFSKWTEKLREAAMVGTSDLMAAFNKGAEQLRLHLVRQHNRDWEQLKIAAATATKAARGGK